MDRKVAMLGLVPLINYDVAYDYEVLLNDGLKHRNVHMPKKNG